MEPILSLVAEVRRLLSDEELIYLQYRRHLECHPFQHDYRMRRDQPGDRLKDWSESHLLKRRVSLDEVWRAVRNVEKAASWRPESVAKSWAQRLLVPLRALDLALQAYGT